MATKCQAAVATGGALGKVGEANTCSLTLQCLKPPWGLGLLPTRAGTSELVMLSLELVKTRLAVMSMEMRKNFIQAILTSLIEKSPDAKILRAVVKIVEEWVKSSSPVAANQVKRGPGVSLLLLIGKS